MRKTGPVLAAVALATLLLLVTGCAGGGGTNAKAVKLMREGDRYVSEFESSPGGGMSGPDESQNQDGNSNQDGITNGRRQGKGEAPPDPAAMSDEERQERTNEMKESMEAMSENLEKAKASYRKILSLDGAEGYKEYAKKMLELVDVYQGERESRDSMAAGFGEGRGPPENAGPPNVSGPGSEEMDARISEMNELRQKVKRLKSEAAEIKEEKNLG